MSMTSSGKVYHLNQINSSNSMRDVIILQYYKDLTKKNLLRGNLGSSSVIWDWH